MCVVFWSKEGDFEIPCVFETLVYELPKEQILANVTAVISNPKQNEIKIGVVHRRGVQIEPAVERWNKRAQGEPDKLVDLISELYDCSFESTPNPTVKFNSQQLQHEFEPLYIAKESTPYEVLTFDDSQNYVGFPRKMPFTAFVFEPMNDKNILYSFDIKIKGDAFRILMDSKKRCGLDGSKILQRKIAIEDLAEYRNSKWNEYFNETIPC